MRQRDGVRHDEEDVEEEKSNWGWVWWVLLGFAFFYFRTGGYGNSMAQTNGGAAPYRTFESENYEPGSVGAFWANEERAARGVPGAVASPGFSFTPPPPNNGLGQVQAEQSMAEQAADVYQQGRMMKLLEQQQAEMEKMRAEIERLRELK
ncbi:MAG: hypothetical protein HS116_05845 [Planctomycetes bacterium]|nr:hypothetical protein [Planctomycetota bacterium]